MQGIVHYLKTKTKNYTFYLFFIDIEKVMPHLKFAPLDYGYSRVYIQKYKVTGNPTLLVASCFSLKVGLSKYY